MADILLHAEPGTVLTWDEFKAAKPPFSMALDGYVSGQTKFTSEGPYANFNHHEDVDRMATRSTCAQIYLSTKLGLFDSFQRNGKPHANVYVNDADQDVCLAYWLLKNPQIATALSWQDPIAPLIVLEDFVDASAGAYPFRAPAESFLKQQAWVFEPYTDARSRRRLHRMNGSDLIGLIETICDRLTLYAKSEGGSIDLDTRHEVIGGGPGWKMIVETGIYARSTLFASGTKVFVGMRTRDDGNYTYVIGKMSPFVPFPVKKIYDALNQAEQLESSDNAWGGSDIIGGSPRKTGSMLRRRNSKKSSTRF